MNQEICDRKKQKGSLNQKQKALARYVEALEELCGPTTSWPYSPRTRRSPERMKEGLQKGIEQLRRELQNANC